MNGPGEFELVWADEFDREGRPDPAKWTYERGFVRNEELQWYRPENARVEHGELVIEARRERVANPQFDDAGSFHAGLAPVWIGNRMGYSNKDGKLIWTPTA